MTDSTESKSPGPSLPLIRPGHVRADLALIEQAIRNQHPINDQIRDNLPTLVAQFAFNQDEQGNPVTNDARVRIRAMSILVMMMRDNTHLLLKLIEQHGLALESGLIIDGQVVERDEDVVEDAGLTNDDISDQLARFLESEKALASGLAAAEESSE